MRNSAREVKGQALVACIIHRLEMRSHGEAKLPWLGRVEVNVVDATSGAAARYQVRIRLQPGTVVIVDVVRFAIEEIENVEMRIPRLV